jgi:hypothetical protein
VSDFLAGGAGCLAYFKTWFADAGRGSSSPVPSAASSGGDVVRDRGTGGQDVLAGKLERPRSAISQGPGCVIHREQTWPSVVSGNTTPCEVMAVSSSGNCMSGVAETGCVAPF